MACLGVITVGQQRVFVLFFTLSAASAAACLRLLCVDDVLGRAISLTNVNAEAGSVVGEVWSAEPACAGRAQHFFEQWWYRQAQHSRAADGGLAALAATRNLLSL